MIGKSSFSVYRFPFLYIFFTHFVCGLPLFVQGRVKQQPPPSSGLYPRFERLKWRKKTKNWIDQQSRWPALGGNSVTCLPSYHPPAKYCFHQDTTCSSIAGLDPSTRQSKVHLPMFPRLSHNFFFWFQRYVVLASTLNRIACDCRYRTGIHAVVVFLEVYCCIVILTVRSAIYSGECTRQKMWLVAHHGPLIDRKGYCWRDAVMFGGENDHTRSHQPLSMPAGTLYPFLPFSGLVYPRWKLVVIMRYFRRKI